MKSSLPKQFLPLGGLPVLMHSIRAFYRFNKDLEIVVALPSGDLPTWKHLCKKHRFFIPHKLAKGGKTRFASVRNSLKQVTGTGLVAIHDGVRPLISGSTIRAAFREAKKFGNAVPAVPVNESVRWVTIGLNEPFPRDQLKIVQTPQVFRLSEIRQAYERASGEDFTDDATVAEAVGGKIHLFRGDPDNIKITYPSDLVLAEALLNKPR